MPPNSSSPCRERGTVLADTIIKSETCRNEHGTFWSACSLRGTNREQNSDALAVSGEGPWRIFVVADGVGALEGSPRASDAAALAAARWAAGRDDVSPADVTSFIESVDLAVRAAVREDPGGTTLACALIGPGDGLVLTVGDSEALAVGSDGPARRLTPIDHLPNQPNMLLAWIDGKVEVEPHVVALVSMPYRLVLATDGVTGALDKAAIADIVRAAPVNAAAAQLVEAARASGAIDDASAIVIAAPPNGVIA